MTKMEKKKTSFCVSNIYRITGMCLFFCRVGDEDSIMGNKHEKC